MMYEHESANLTRLRPFLSECAVLLRRDGKYPLDMPGTIAAYGNGIRHTVKGGTGSGEVNSRFFINVEEGLKSAGFTLTSDFWLDCYDRISAGSRQRFLEEAKKALWKDPLGSFNRMGLIAPEPEYNIPLNYDADSALYVLSRISGEGTDRTVTRGDYLLTDSERRDILNLAAHYEKFMLVINAGGPVDLTGLESVGNILVLSQLGVETGSVLADLLLGKAVPSGKLATTWVSAEDVCPVGEFAEEETTRYLEGIYVGYRYFDSVGKKALYPFGFGLGYTDFAVSGAKASLTGETVTVTARVKNTGKYPGKEVLQLYAEKPQGRLDQPKQVLAAFAKTELLQPGEKQICTLSFAMSELASFDTKDACYVLEKGNYILRLGTSSADSKTVTVIGLDRDAVTRRVKNLPGKPGFTDWKPARKKAKKTLARLKLKAESIPRINCSYQRTDPVSPEVQKLSDRELVMLNVGRYSENGGLQSIVGDAGISVAGAAGESRNGLVMADGPAGLRLSREYIRTEQGTRSLGKAMPESMAEFFPDVILSILNRLAAPKTDENTEILEQYTTAIPIGTAIAQSWNEEFADLCGDVVGSEMELYGVDLWLAPALNIHRNVLCGRNFEYYSEDPLISGKITAAVVRGVQRHPRCGATVKHFAANNQETRRYSNDSRVSERALREIYLRGFEIAVRESSPKALMTSYNLVNGVHTSMNRALINDVLRCEWGFDGVVMTDWLIAQSLMSRKSKNPAAHAWQIAGAGNDFLMPGSEGDVKEMLAGLKKHKLSRQQLEINGTRVLALAEEFGK